MMGDPLNVVLFALTGFGNTVLEALLQDARVHVGAVFTVKYDNAFPYYSERQLIDLCEERRVTCYSGVKVSSDDGVELLRQIGPDLIVVATFKQILKENVIRLPRLGVVNFHPSLLPRYRGPCPTNAALANDDKVTGVTVHYITERLDEGDILVQRSIDIGDSDNDGQLRRKLAILSGEMVPEVMDRFDGLKKPSGTPQDNDLATLAPKPKVEDGYIELAPDIDSARRMMRAFNPLPGTSILVGSKRVAVDRYELLDDKRPDGIYIDGNSTDLIIASRAIRLYEKREGQSY
jgi:methionyl-tRNA formyltransferase